MKIACTAFKCLAAALGLPFLLACATVLFVSANNCPPAAAADIAIALRPAAEVRGPEIFLGEVGAIDCADVELGRQLNGLVVGKAPLPGRSRRLDADILRLRLRQMDVDPETVRFVGAGSVQVSTAAMEVGDDQIRQIVADYIRTSDAWGEADVSIADLQISSDRTLPKGRATYRVVPPQHLRSLAVLPLSIVFDVDGRFQKTIRATVRLRVSAPVVVAARPIGRLKPIAREDLRLETVDLTETADSAVSDLEEVIGQRARRNIDAGTVLRPDLIEYPPLVKRGDTVVIVAESEGLRISAVGEVKSAGQRGDRVKVVNLDSNKRIFARVVDKNTVKVDF